MAPPHNGNVFGRRHQRGKENRQDDWTKNTSPEQRRNSPYRGGSLKAPFDGQPIRALLVVLLLLAPLPAMSCTWKWEITLYSGGKTWKEEIVANNRQDAERVAIQRNPHAKVIARNPVCR